MVVLNINVICVHSIYFVQNAALQYRNGRYTLLDYCYYNTMRCSAAAAAAATHWSANTAAAAACIVRLFIKQQCYFYFTNLQMVAVSEVVSTELFIPAVGLAYMGYFVCNVRLQGFCGTGQ